MVVFRHESEMHFGIDKKRWHRTVSQSAAEIVKCAPSVGCCRSRSVQELVEESRRARSLGSVTSRAMGLTLWLPGERFNGLDRIHENSGERVHPGRVVVSG